MSLFGLKERIFGSSVDGPEHNGTDALAHLAEKVEHRDGRVFEEVIMGPLQEAIMGPLQEAIRGPLQEAIRGPLQEAMRGPLQEAIRGPLHEAIRVPLQEAIRVPLQEAIRVPLQEAIRVPLQEAIKGPFQETIVPLTEMNRHGSRAVKPSPLDTSSHSVTEHFVRHQTRHGVVKTWGSSSEQPGTPYPVSRLEAKDGESRLLQLALFAAEEEEKTETGDKLLQIVEDVESRND